MLNIIYLIILAIAILVMSFFTFYSHSWLQSIGNPLDAAEGYEYYSSLAWTFLWGSFVCLLILSNILIWKKRRLWAIWASFGFFAVFILLRYFWLENAFFNFQKINNLTQSSFSFGPLFGIILCLIAGAIVFFDQFLVLRMQCRLQNAPPTFEEIPVPENESADVIEKTRE